MPPISSFLRAERALTTYQDTHDILPTDVTRGGYSVTRNGTRVLLLVVKDLSIV